MQWHGLFAMCFILESVSACVFLSLTLKTVSLTLCFYSVDLPGLKRKLPWATEKSILTGFICLSLFLSLQPSILTVLLNCNKKSLKSNGPMPLRSSGSSQRQPQMSSQADMLVPYQDSASKGPFTVLQWCQSHSSLVWIMELCLGTSPFPWCFMTANTILRGTPRLIMETPQSRCLFHREIIWNTLTNSCYGWIHSMNLWTCLSKGKYLSELWLLKLKHDY